MVRLDPSQRDQTCTELHAQTSTGRLDHSLSRSVRELVAAIKQLIAVHDNQRRTIFSRRQIQ